LPTYRIAVLPGDGIGPEVMAAAIEVLESLPGLRFDFEELPVGYTALQAVGDPLPSCTIEKAKAADAVLHGAMDGAAIPASYRAPMTGLRRALDAYASVRPSISYPGLAALHDKIDVVVVRETTEGLYSKIEYKIGADVACSVRTITRTGMERVARRAFELAATRRRSVTVAHKLAGLPVADAFMLDVVRGIAAEFPDIELHEANVDALAHDLILRPADYDVILAENQYGDILSDVASAVAGGLGLAASACLGDRWAYFEPVHGSAPDIAGRGLANPGAMLLAAAMMLDHLGERDAAGLVRTAVSDVLAEGSTLTADLGGSASTTEFTRAVVTRLRSATGSPEPTQRGRQ
jgi:isocitrate/isopropylmalate dehydrogenase